MSTRVQIINGYRLKNQLLTGQTSMVWEVTQEATGRPYAMKLLLPERINDSEHRGYLQNEAKVGLQLHHPKIIKIFEYFPIRDNPHFVMELFPGNNLKQRIMRKSEILDEHMASIIEQTADALAYMHERKWLHKDIKPDNVLVNGAGEVRLIDFALSQRIGMSWQRLFKKKGGVVKGTRSYMSPEQIRGETLDERADVYGFGCTLYELLTGRPPFRADTPKRLLEKHLYEQPRSVYIHNPALTREIDDLIMRMLAKERKDRIENLRDFLAKFRNIKIYNDQAKQPSK